MMDPETETPEEPEGEVKFEPEPFDIVVPVERPGQRKFWLKIGIATRVAPRKFLCSLASIPIGWDGAFVIREAGARELNGRRQR